MLSIWEGTTNVLSLDVWRPIKSHNALEVFFDRIDELLANVSHPSLVSVKEVILKGKESIHKISMSYLSTADQEMMEATARHFAFG